MHDGHNGHEHDLYTVPALPSAEKWLWPPAVLGGAPLEYPVGMEARADAGPPLPGVVAAHALMDPSNPWAVGTAIGLGLAVWGGIAWKLFYKPWIDMLEQPTEDDHPTGDE